MPRRVTWIGCLLALTAVAAPAAASPDVDVRRGAASASSMREGSTAAGASDGERFATTAESAWMGRPGERDWHWQIEFPSPRNIGAVLQINGDDDAVLRNAPRDYVWQVSLDGRTWQDLSGTRVRGERRMYRVHRLARPVTARWLRIRIDAANGEFPTLREVEIHSDTAAGIEFPDWIVTVSTLETNEAEGGLGAGREFAELARRCEGWETLASQRVLLGDFDEAFVSAEPRPLAAFLSGNLCDWCQKDRHAWRGTQEVLARRNLPMWASCGGAQGLAILSEVGCDQPWDCPHCRDPQDPKLAIYTHIGHTARRPCGDYSCCLDERGAFEIVPLARDPAFAGLPPTFQAMESHCGQIDHPPAGWVQIATHGAGGKTKMQCMRVKDRYIYAAQFHIEMAGTPDTSRQIMTNFLRLAKAWGGYNPRGNPVPEPKGLRASGRSEENGDSAN